MTGPQLFRVPPAMPVTSYKTYGVQVPRATHTRPATCREVECEAWAHGWTTTVDVSTDLGARQAKYIVDHSGRRYTVRQQMNGNPVRHFDFPPGQQCFREHRIQIKPPLYVVRDGDHRGNPTGRRQLLTDRAWVDDFGEHQETLADKQKEG